MIRIKTLNYDKNNIDDLNISIAVKDVVNYLVADELISHQEAITHAGIPSDVYFQEHDTIYVKLDALDEEKAQELVELKKSMKKSRKRRHKGGA